MDQQEHVKHICEVGMFTISVANSQTVVDGTVKIRRTMEETYVKLKERVKAEKSAMLGITQTISTESIVGGTFVVYIITLTATVVSLEEVERQRRMQQFAGVNGLRNN